MPIFTDLADTFRMKQELGKNYIREWREHRNLSLDKLVDRLPVDEFGNSMITKTSLSRIERSIQPYSQPLLEALSEALQCSPGDLLMRNPLIKDSVWSIADQLRRATPEQRSLIASALDGMLKTGT
jgi:transcriptional regulator with XRE-family HTH domain